MMNLIRMECQFRSIKIEPEAEVEEMEEVMQYHVNCNPKVLKLSD